MAFPKCVFLYIALTEAVMKNKLQITEASWVFHISSNYCASYKIVAIFIICQRWFHNSLKVNIARALAVIMNASLVTHSLNAHRPVAVDTTTIYIINEPWHSWGSQWISGCLCPGLHLVCPRRRLILSHFSC